jgi:hypothetical protein
MMETPNQDVWKNLDAQDIRTSKFDGHIEANKEEKE